ncbi:MAG: toll/interleukin-1 receptor domain-containing protein [Oscillospiraceae bacterium]|nr:toll/interleukin-1 receptor domain-containing protein [Oscillospiraceae bacterium]
MRFEYDAFFSYRHRPLDQEITQKAFNALESYKLPKSLREQGYEDIHRAFRDTEELPVTRILTETIDDALHSCNCLIVVCSTDTPVSEWIDREVSVFIEIGRADHIYPLLITGDPEHSFPPSLKLVPDIADRIMDIRCPGNDVKKMMAKAETEMLKVIAGITGCDEDELRREHQMRRNRRLITRAAGAAAILLAVTGISLGIMGIAKNYRNEAALREQASMRILNELTYSLPDNLTNVPGAYSKIADILERNTEDINAILRLSRNKEAAEFEASANYERLATASSVLGSQDKALEAQKTAIASYEELAGTGTKESKVRLASAYNNLAILYTKEGRYEEAASAYGDAISTQLQAGDEGLQLIRMYQNAGANALSAGDAATAYDYYDKCIDLLANPKTTSELDYLGRVHLNYGNALHREGRYSEAEEHIRTAIDYYEKLLQYKDSALNRTQVIQAQSVLGTVLTDAGRFEEADQIYAAAIAEAELLAQDKENMPYQRNLSDLYNNRGVAFNTQGDYASADEMYSKAVELYRTISEKTGTASDRAMLAKRLTNLAENSFKIPDYSRSKEYFKEAFRVYEQVLDGLGQYDEAIYLSWLSYYRLIHERDYPAAYKTANEAHELQPDNTLVNMIRGYACLYDGHYDDAEKILTEVAALGRGQAEMIQIDLEAQQKAGMWNEHIPELLKALEAIS